ncbi:MAG: hypothetical protein NTZ72_05100 [Afipia sp.]|nr:hypothetical protein [Afipia sp.]
MGAAEFAPPASGTIALFSIAIEFDVFSSPLPVVAAGDVVQLVSCFSLDGLVVWAFADATTNDAAMTAVAKRIIFISRDRKTDRSNPGNETCQHYNSSHRTGLAVDQNIRQRRK